MYVAIDRKPENGCEIQNAACGRSGIILRLSVVTTAEHRQKDATGEEEDLPHGIAVLKKLVPPGLAPSGLCALIRTLRA